MTKSLITATVAAALAAATLAAPAVAGSLRVDTRDSWAPGYHHDGGGYVRFVEEPQAVGRGIERETSTAWAPGFTREDGQYVRDDRTGRSSAMAEAPAATRLQREEQHAWAPGFHREDGRYVRYRMVPVDTGTALAAVPAAADDAQ